MANISIPPKPVLKQTETVKDDDDNVVMENGQPKKKASEEEVLKYQQQQQEYWFAINSLQNQQNQEAMTKSNMQKSAHDAMMEVARNLK